MSDVIDNPEPDVPPLWSLCEKIMYEKRLTGPEKFQVVFALGMLLSSMSGKTKKGVDHG